MMEMTEMIDQATHLPLSPAIRAMAVSAGVTAVLLARRRLHLPHTWVGRRMSFADGTSARVYRETVADQPSIDDPAVLIVEFRLLGVRGWGHAVFRAESLLNTPLFAGFPGFISKLWLAHDDKGRYRGVYQWDGPELAAAYAQALWWALALVSDRRSIRYRVLPGLLRDAFLHDPDLAGPWDGNVSAWWRPMATA
jgi:hypothetical protein